MRRGEFIRPVWVYARSATGACRFFLCKPSDGPYWLKGRYTGIAGLCHEWIAGQMARKFGLPVPSFDLIEVGREIISGSSLPDADELGVGPAFASRHVVSDGDLSFTTFPLNPFVEWSRKLAQFSISCRGENENPL